MRGWIWIVWLLLLLLSGCYTGILSERVPDGQITVIPPETPEIEVSTLPGDLWNALPVVGGICYEAAWDAADQVFIIRSAQEHIRFYDLADHSRLCPRPVTRHPFDFSNGDVLAGIWHRGIGCTANHTIREYIRDDSTQTIRIDVQFNTSGDCPYELVRGFWVRIPSASEYTITLNRVD